MSPRPAWLDGGRGDGEPDARTSGPSPATRQLVLQRASHRCESCGEHLTGRLWSLHHRRLSAMGGTRAEVAHSPTNLVALCGVDNSGGCHGLVHRNVQAAREAGLLVRRSADPARVPVQLHDGRRVLLRPDGTYQESVEEDADA